MLRDYLARLVGWIGSRSADDERRRANRAQHDACKHGESGACPYYREGFDCNDCEVDEKTGEFRPRM